MRSTVRKRLNRLRLGEREREKLRVSTSPLLSLSLFPSLSPSLSDTVARALYSKVQQDANEMPVRGVLTLSSVHGSLASFFISLPSRGGIVSRTEHIFKKH